MFEFEQFDPAAIGQVVHPSLEADIQKKFGRERIRSYSVMNWGEHCTECAFPSCYTTCSFYNPRQDGRCRRFTFGIFPAREMRSWMAYSAFVEFKNWSQLWAQGNATQLPKSLNATLQFIGAMAWAMSAPIDKLLQKATGKKRLSLALQSIRRRVIRQTAKLYRKFPEPDCLLIEVFNPMKVDAQLQLRVRGDNKAARYEWTDCARPGFSSFAIPVLELERRIDLSKPFELFLTVAEEDGKRLYFCSATFVRLASVPVAVKSAKAEPVRKIKCVVWDLDNTLWDGVVVEANGTALKLKDGIRSVLEELDRRGILLSIASKNNEDDARKILEALGVWRLFVAPQIHWQPKSASIKQIAKNLNIGLDSLAFLDDMDFERDEVSTTLPMVATIPAEQFLSILGKPEFAGDASSEGSSRRLMYQTEMKREEAMEKAGLGYDEFLESCNIRISIRRPNDELLPRINDIVQRTNQLNIATQRYDMDELRALVHGEECHSYIVSCSDKYGDYGHVGFIVIALKQNGILIRDCMFSCRVQGKRIDEAVLAHLINHYLQNGVSVVQARFNPTKRNAPAGEMLERVGFVPESSGTLALANNLPRQEVGCIQIESDFTALHA